MNNRATARSTASATRVAAPARSSTASRGGAVPAPRTTPRTPPHTPPRTAPRTAPRPELRLVPGATPARPRRRASRALRHSRAPFVLLLVALLVGTTLGLLFLNTAIAVDSLEATRLRADNAERAQEVQRLEQQVISGATPAEITRAAVAANLVPAGPAAYLVIDADGGSVLRGTAVPAEEPDAPEDGD
jgi:hypothetical protein